MDLVGVARNNHEAEPLRKGQVHGIERGSLR